MASVLPQLNGLKGAALDFCFRDLCGCGGEGRFICNSCQAGTNPEFNRR